MTAFEPPDFTYFTGLQFNPEIYENPLTDSAGAFPINPTFNSVRAPIVYTDSIQRDTATTIHLFDAFPSVTSILIGLQGMLFIFGEWVIAGATISGAGLPAIGFGDGSNDVVFTGVNAYIYGSSAIEMVSGLITDTVVRLEPTFAYIQSATTTIRNASSTIIASFTSALSSITSTEFRIVSQTAATLASFTNAIVSLQATNINIGRASACDTTIGVGLGRNLLRGDTTDITGTTQVAANSPLLYLNTDGPYETFIGRSTGTVTFRGAFNVNELTGGTNTIGNNTGTTNITGTTTITGTNTLTGTSNALSATTTTITGTTTNLNATTKNIAGVTTNLNSTTTNCNTNLIISATGQFSGTGSAGDLILYNGDSCSNTSLTTFNGLNPASNPTNSVLFVQFAKVAATTCNLSTTHRDGFVWYLVNQGQATCTVNYGTANIFGPGLTRGGTTTCSIVSGGARMFRSCIFPSGSIGGGFTNGWFTTLL